MHLTKHLKCFPLNYDDMFPQQLINAMFTCGLTAIGHSRIRYYFQVVKLCMYILKYSVVHPQWRYGFMTSS